MSSNHNHHGREDNSHDRSSHHRTTSERARRSEVNRSRENRRSNSPERPRSHSSGHEHRHHHSHSHGRPRHEEDRSPRDVRVLRCFCNCSELTLEQIENVAMMSVSELVNNPLGNRLFNAFLGIGHRHDQSEAMRTLECYELCNTISEDITQYREYIDELFTVCPSYEWECRVMDIIEEKKWEEVFVQLPSILDELRLECAQKIQSHVDFDRFRRALLRKIGK